MEKEIIHTKPPSHCPQCPDCGRPMWMMAYTYTYKDADHEEVCVYGWECRGGCSEKYMLGDDIPPYIPTRFDMMDFS